MCLFDGSQAQHAVFRELDGDATQLDDQDGIPQHFFITCSCSFMVFHRSYHLFSLADVSSLMMNSRGPTSEGQEDAYDHEDLVHEAHGVTVGGAVVSHALLRLFAAHAVEERLHLRLSKFTAVQGLGALNGLI